MSAGDAAATRASALSAAAALASYERHVRRLATTWLDMELYRTVSAEIDAIGRACAQLPSVRVPWVALLVSHAELVHALWRSDGQSADLGGCAEALHEHLQCIDALARRCLRVAGLSRRAAAVD
jgi:hypothetical protein